VVASYYITYRNAAKTIERSAKAAIALAQQVLKDPTVDNYNDLLGTDTPFRDVTQDVANIGKLTDKTLIPPRKEEEMERMLQNKDFRKFAKTYTKRTKLLRDKIKGLVAQAGSTPWTRHW
jgi:hypothetical protein